MPQGFWTWSKTAATNASVDSSVNWAEGQPPSSINDSARAMMARIAEYRDDNSGAIIGTGTASAYAITTNQPYSAVGDLFLSTFTFLCPATNADGVTLNVNSLGALPIRTSDGGSCPAGTLLQNGIYTVTSYHG
jgi:hypothetical protein